MTDGWWTVVRFFFIISHVQSYKVEVKIRQGTVIGTVEATVFNRKVFYAFYGIPYASPPIGKLRFKDPKPGKNWKRPFDARTEHHSACSQIHVVHKHAIYGVEDCLYLNIYTPTLFSKNNSLRPVVVWIHGYAFTSSFSHIYGGDFFIENDVIFVSLTHRIGVFGFLKYDEKDTNANMGLKDIVMGLKWIRRNIKQFGGNKENITVMASDSAGTFLSLLLITKSNKLFSKLILHSGALFSPSIFQTNGTLERERLVKKLKQINSKSLMKASAKDILLASTQIYDKKDWINFQKPITGFSPILEKESNKSIITINPYEIIKHFQLRKPILIGYNSQESISEIIPFLRDPLYLKYFKKLFKFMVPFANSCSHHSGSKHYHEIAQEIKQAYFKGAITDNSIQDFIRYVSDLHKYPTYKFIKEIIKNAERDIFVYQFNYVGKFNIMKATSTQNVNVKIKGAAKGDELCYLMKCEPLWENYVKIRNINMKNETQPDLALIKNLSTMWSNFVKLGNPTPEPLFGNLTWLPMTSGSDHMFMLSKYFKMTDTRNEDWMFRFWEQLYKKYYSSERCKQTYRDEL